MIRPCTPNDNQTILAIINEAASVYRGVIPPECLHQPYMSMTDLNREMLDGVVFYGYEHVRRLVGVMGIQEKGPVTLIRHAYVRSDIQNHGIGTLLLCHLETSTTRPVLVGTWEDASWAIGFYRKNGFKIVSKELSTILLQTYWTIPQRQIETSVVLVQKEWMRQDGSLHERIPIPGGEGE